MGGAVLINKTTGKPEWVNAAQIQEALSSGKYFSKTGEANVQGSEGGEYRVRVDALEKNVKHGMEQISNTEILRRNQEEEKRAQYDTAWNKAVAFSEGLASSLTLGAADILMDDEATRMRSSVNSGWRSFGEVTGIVAPAIATGGLTFAGRGATSVLAKGLALTPSGLAAKVATAAGKSVGKKFAAGSVRSATAAMAIEGIVESTMFTAGSALSQAIVEDKDLTAEALLSVAEGAALGGAIGGVLGGVGRGIKNFKEARAAKNFKAANPMFDLASEQSVAFRKQVLNSVDEAVNLRSGWREKLEALEVLELHGAKLGKWDGAKDLLKQHDKVRDELLRAAGLKGKYKNIHGRMEWDVLTDEQLTRFFKQAKPKDIINFVKKLDDFHNSTSQLDDLFAKRADINDYMGRPQYKEDYINDPRWKPEGAPAPKAANAAQDTKKTGSIKGPKNAKQASDPYLDMEIVPGQTIPPEDLMGKFDLGDIDSPGVASPARKRDTLSDVGAYSKNPRRPALPPKEVVPNLIKAVEELEAVNPSAVDDAMRKIEQKFGAEVAQAVDGRAPTIRIMGKDKPASGKTLPGSEAPLNAAIHLDEVKSKTIPPIGKADTLPGSEAAANAAANKAERSAMDDFDAELNKWDKAKTGQWEQVGDANITNVQQRFKRMSWGNADDINAANRIKNDIVWNALEKLERGGPRYKSAKAYAEEIDEIGKMLKEHGVDKVSALDALAVADLLGVDVDKVPVLGPVASSVLNMWMFYRLGSAMAPGAKVAVQKGRGGIAKFIASNAAARKAAEYGRQKMGALGAGAGYAAGMKGFQAAWDAVGNMGAATGRFTTRAKEVIGKVLNPTVKGVIKKRVPVMLSLSNVSFGPGLDNDPKDDYGRIEAELLRAQDQQVMQNFLNQELQDVRLIDPGTADAMITARMAQAKYLYQNLPKPPPNWPPGLSWQPKQSDWIPFKELVALYKGGPEHFLQKLEAHAIDSKDVENFRALYPRSAQEVTDEAVNAYSQLDPNKVTKQQRRTMDILVGMPGDADLVAATQEGYTKKKNEKQSAQASKIGKNIGAAGVPLPGQQFALGASLNMF